jgi:hypothetical protein
MPGPGGARPADGADPAASTATLIRYENFRCAAPSAPRLCPPCASFGLLQPGCSSKSNGSPAACHPQDPAEARRRGAGHVGCGGGGALSPTQARKVRFSAPSPRSAPAACAHDLGADAALCGCSSSSLTRAFGALSTADEAAPRNPAPRLFARVDTFTLDEAARLGASLGSNVGSADSDSVSQRLQSKVSEMQERRKLARTVGLKRATAEGTSGSVVAGSPRRLDTSKLNRYAAVREKRKAAAAAGGAATAGKASDSRSSAADTGSTAAAAAAAAATEAPATATSSTAKGLAADAALLELAAEVAAAESHAADTLGVPKWDVVDVEVGVVEAAQNAQKARLTSMLNGSISSNPAKLSDDAGVAAGGGGSSTLTCNGVAMVSTSAAAGGVENQAPATGVGASTGGEGGSDGVSPVSAGDGVSPVSVVGAEDSDDWEYDYFAVVPDAAPGDDLAWMGAVEMDYATSGGGGGGGGGPADIGSSLAAQRDPVRTCSICLPPVHTYIRVFNMFPVVSESKTCIFGIAAWSK